MLCCLEGHFAGMCPLVLHPEQYGCSGQSFLRWPSCLQQKQSHSSGALDLFGCLLHFTPLPFANLGMCCSGELDIGLCVSAAGMKGWVDRLVSVLRGLCCVTEDDCSVFWGCVHECMLSELCNCDVAGCGGTTDCGGVC